SGPLSIPQAEPDSVASKDFGACLVLATSRGRGHAKDSTSSILRRSRVKIPRRPPIIRGRAAARCGASAAQKGTMASHPLLDKTGNLVGRVGESVWIEKLPPPKKVLIDL